MASQHIPPASTIPVATYDVFFPLLTGTLKDESRFDAYYIEAPNDQLGGSSRVALVERLRRRLTRSSGPG